MSVARQLLKKIMTGVLPQERFLVCGPDSSAYSNGHETSQKEIALTFDDGPHPEWTPAVLDALAEAGWKGTFFVVGERAAEHPLIVKRIVTEGHAIGNHTFTHSDPQRTTATQFHVEVKQTDALITELTGTRTVLMRPPKGHLTPGKFRGLWREGQSIILWNIDPEDFAMTEESEPLNWARSYVPHQGDVLLLHDRLPHAATIVQTLSLATRGEVRSVPITHWLPATQPNPLSQLRHTAISG